VYHPPVRRALALSLAILSACGSAEPLPATAVVLPGPAGAPPLPVATDAPSALAGVDTGELSSRERGVFWRLVSELYAPCPDQAVSIRQCVAEARPCAACRPAAKLLAQKVREGAGMEEGRAIYGARFGPKVTKVDVGGSPARGPSDAPVTVLVWHDFGCPHCRMAMPVLERAFAKHSPRVRLAHKFYPLRQHPNSEAAARAAIAAQNQGRYWEMERALFDHQSEQAPPDLDRYAQGLRLDMNRFHADMAADATTKMLARDHEDAERAGLGGTPFILINGREFDTSYFKLDRDLDAWIALEIELGGAR
jgi:2-hydroxychromene-2-carboxylate isomerase